MIHYNDICAYRYVLFSLIVNLLYIRALYFPFIKTSICDLSEASYSSTVHLDIIKISKINSLQLIITMEPLCLKFQTIYYLLYCYHVPFSAHFISSARGLYPVKVSMRNSRKPQKFSFSNGQFSQPVVMQK